MRFEVKPKKVCPSMISFDLDGEVVTNVEFMNGCSGNLKAISKVIEGMTVAQIEGFFKGNTCGRNDTSCADQLAVAVRQAFESSKS